MNYMDKIIFTTATGTSFVGHYIGAAKRIDGVMYGIGETTHGLVFMGPVKQMKLYEEASKLPEGSVVIVNKEDTPAKKVLPPLTSSKY